MTRRHARLGIAGAALAALVGSALSAAPPASAAFDGGSGWVSASVDTDDYTGDCDVSPTDDSSSKELYDNGVPVSQSYSETATVTKNGNPVDISTVKGSASATASATPVGGTVPATIKMSGSSSASATAALGDEVTECEARVESYSSAGGSITLTQPTWATITASGSNTGTLSSGLAFIEAEGNSVGVSIGRRSSGTVTALLPAGPLDFYVEFQSRAYADQDATRRAATASGTVTIKLSPVGSASAAAGKAKGTVVLGARNCATGAVSGTLTKKAKKKATSVVVEVNGMKRASFKKKKLKKRAFTVPTAKSAPVTVVATIKLKNGKTLKLTRSYLAC